MDADDESQSCESLFLDAEDKNETDSLSKLNYDAETGNTPSDSNAISNAAPPNISSDQQAADTNAHDEAATTNNTASPAVTNAQAVSDETTKVSADTVEQVRSQTQGSADKNENLPATPPATPITNGEQPQFPSQILNTTPETDKYDVVSVPPSDKPDLTSTVQVNSEVPKTDLTEAPKTELPPTPIESIATPILEAATIVHAVAGISISDPSTPVPISTPTGLDSEVLFSPLASLAQKTVELQKIAADENVATTTQLGGPLPIVPPQSNKTTVKNVRDEEVESLRARVQALEAELVAALSKPGTKNHVLVETIKQQNEELLSRAKGMLFEKTKIMKNQELQIEALSAQVASLKDVNSITKDLLEIRNSEIKHLEERMSSMEERFKHEKERHVLVLKRAETGQSINNDLKTEYEGQLKIFKELREMYEKRVQVLMAENQRLNETIAATKAQSSATEE